MADLPKLDQALERFDSAIGDLESALSRLKDAGQVQPAAQDDGEAQALREDRARLASELEEVRANAERLQEKSRAAAEKMSGAMAKIKSVLGDD